jgi:pseudouridylate synthase / pseudouridine kinase
MPAAYSLLGTPQISGVGSSNCPSIASKQVNSTSPSPKPEVALEADILVAGSVAVDLSCDFIPTALNADINPVVRTSNPALILQSIGGVGHNVAAAAQLIGTGTSVRLCSLIADDLAGGMILSSLKERGLDTTAIRTLKAKGGEILRTAQYVAVNDANKDLVLAMADMRIISSHKADFSPWQSLMETSKPKWVVVDANWDQSAMLKWIRGAKNTGARVAFEPVSVARSSKLFDPQMKSPDGNADE